MLITRALPPLVLAVVLVGCGRSDPNGALDAVEADAVARVAASEVAREVAFDTEEELTVLLDDDYLAAETVLLQESDVETIATDIATQITGDLAFTTVDQLRAVLDDQYLSVGSAIDLPGVEAAAAAVCFDTELELTTLLDDNYFDSENDLTAQLDDQYLPIDFQPDFGDLIGVPLDLADGDDNTVVAVTPPLELNGTTLALDTAGCVNGEVLLFNAGAFSCQRQSAAPTDATAVGAAGANARPFEALPVLVKVEALAVAVAADATQDVVIYTGAAGTLNGNPRNFLMLDAWAVTTANVAAGTPTWHVRDATTQVTTDVAVGVANGDVGRVVKFNNNGARTVSAGETLTLRISSPAVASTSSFTVYILAAPL